jgi:lysophospholipase L1-like esterase
MRFQLICLLTVLTAAAANAQTTTPGSVPGLDEYKLTPAPPTTHLLLKKGDRLAICGDSITEQKMYSRIIEDYLTMCTPELKVTVRQFGWSGEHAPEFLRRMTNDCLRFNPTIATTCYGMNDCNYTPYNDAIGDLYRTNQAQIVESFKAHGVRVVLGSAGCVGKVPFWAAWRVAKDTNETTENLNLNLGTLRNIDVEIAGAEGVAFADVFQPMLAATLAMQAKYGTNYAVSGHDGVHPGWAGHTIMAYAFLKGLGLKGDIGTFTVNLANFKIRVSPGHKVISAKDGAYEITSSRYPFCPCEPAALSTVNYPTCENDDPTRDNSIRSGMTLVPFNRDLNRFMLVARNGQAQSYKVTWGDQSKSFTAQQLADGINLATEFPENPFSAAFAKVDAAVAVKQAYETKQIKEAFRSPAAKADMEGVVADTEKTRQPLADAIAQAFEPVTYTLTIAGE